MISTGNAELDSHFMYCDSINCIYGKAATGKTNLCLLLASKTARDKKVLYIDTEGSFSPERVRQFGPEEALRNIFVMRAGSFDEQCKIVDGLLMLKGKIGMVIVDSLSMHYRQELQGRNDNANSKLSRQLSILSELTRSSIPVIITSQVYSTMDNGICPVGGNMVKNWSQCLIKLEYGRQRTLTVEKHPELPGKSAHFEIRKGTIAPA